ncbi:NADH-quinone oxidoreductase subunit J [Ottowia sp.]|uniref:NADH-quinone oxidoreductase subunit J n=1 Tax=Ottowia sp. TaxID=1898956 RepID=UPI002C4EB643|nr:NADH-quinone oxidoreductase subunit J [Ottowia sp.]
MDVPTAFFYLFSLVMLFSAFRVITARNPVHAVLFLMLAFSQAAGVWLLLQAEFLAITLVLVYLGAVMVLFLFVVMMLDIHIDSLRQGFWRHFPLALVIGAVISLEMAAVLFGGFRASDARPMPELPAVAGQVAQYSNTKALGVLMYTKYLYPLEIAAVILLIAMIAAIALTLREKRKDNKAIDPSLAVRVHARDRVQLVKLAPTQAPVAAPAPAAAPAEEVKK